MRAGASAPGRIEMALSIDPAWLTGRRGFEPSDPTRLHSAEAQIAHSLVCRSAAVVLIGRRVVVVTVLKADASTQPSESVVPETEASPDRA